MTRTEAYNYVDDNMHPHPYNREAMVDALLKGIEIGKAEKEAVDTKEFIGESLKMLEEERARVRAGVVDNACLQFCVCCPNYADCDDRYNCPRYDKFEKFLEGE